MERVRKKSPHRSRFLCRELSLNRLLPATLEGCSPGRKTFSTAALSPKAQPAPPLRLLGNCLGRSRRRRCIFDSEPLPQLGEFLRVALALLGFQLQALSFVRLLSCCQPQQVRHPLAVAEHFHAARHPLRPALRVV